LVVEDSLTARKRLVEVLEATGEIQVVGEAEDGKRAIELCLQLRPDVMTLDMMLPVMSGLAATEYIMAYCPTPILIVSSSTNRGELFKTYDALAAGAVDVLDKPSGLEAQGEWEARLRSTVKLVSRVKVITHPRARLNAAARPPSPDAFGGPAPVVVALGASTGGPAAVVDVLRKLRAPFPAPILLVLHIGAQFGSALADWLDGQTTHRVSMATEGLRLDELRGRVIMAPPERHLFVSGGRLRLSSGPERHSCRPSVDVLFESLAAEGGASTVACLMTGMGRDGAAGLLAIRIAGGRTFAQDEATSVAYGMPREAAQAGAAEVILPLPEIADALTYAAGALAKRSPP
jgi:two-component system chemotaxis response regulator CheB